MMSTQQQQQQQQDSTSFHSLLERHKSLHHRTTLSTTHDMNDNLLSEKDYQYCVRIAGLMSILDIIGGGMILVIVKELVMVLRSNEFVSFYSSLSLSSLSSLSTISLSMPSILSIPSISSLPSISSILSSLPSIPSISSLSSILPSSFEPSIILSSFTTFMASLLVLPSILISFLTTISQTITNSIYPTLHQMVMNLSSTSNQWKIIVMELLYSISFEQWKIFIGLLSISISSFLLKSIFLLRSIQSKSRNIQLVIASQIQEAQLYLRLISGIPINKDISKTISLAVIQQMEKVVYYLRFYNFVIVSITFVIVQIISNYLNMIIQMNQQPILMNDIHVKWQNIIRLIFGNNKGDGIEQQTQIQQIAGLQWRNLLSSFKVLLGMLVNLVVKSSSDVVATLKNVIIQPKFFLDVYLFLTLIAILVLPRLMMMMMIPQRRLFNNNDKKGLGDVELDLEHGSLSNIESVTASTAALGISSSARLNLLSSNGCVEDVLDLWHKRMANIRDSSTTIATATTNLSHSRPSLRTAGVLLLIDTLLMGPLIMFGILQFNTETSILGLVTCTNHDWAKIAGMTVWLLIVRGLARGAVLRHENSFQYSSRVASFLGSLSSTVNEVSADNRHENKQINHIESSDNGAFMNNGIDISDLWVSHKSKRAWACRGASISCGKREVIAILGDHSSGKSRLLAGIYEAVIQPPLRSRSTMMVRGNVSIGGINVAKWDMLRLRRRLGIVLNDVRTIADYSYFHSGSSLNDILEPRARGNIPERVAVKYAMEISGLSSNLLSRLPSNLSTIVTANEDELIPSSTKPSPIFLSQSEWVSVILTKAIARAIARNDSTRNFSNSISNCMDGSILLLDDVSAHMSEGEEEIFIKSLKSSGAIALITSNRWYIGCLTDRIVVIKNGSIVESGSHTELLKQGPQKSVYAAKWAELTRE